MKNIIFDIDGTLWNTTEVVAKAWNRAIQEVGGIDTVITASILKKEFGKPMNIIADDLFPGIDEEKREHFLKKCYQYEHEALEKNTDHLLFPDVVETLKILSEKYALFIVSNCQKGYIELFMRKAKIQDLIRDYECFGNTRKSKGENIKLVIERNHLEDAVYVGDTQGDYEAAREAGIPFVFARYGFGSPEHYDAAIDGIKELLSLAI